MAMTALTPRHKFVQSFAVEDSLRTLDELDAKLLRVGKERLTAQEAVQSAERQVEVAEAHVWLRDIDATNPEKRKAQFAIAAQADPAVQSAREKLSHNRAWLAELETDAAHTERQVSMMKRRLQLVDTTLRFLASESA